MGSLLAHDIRISGSYEKAEEKVFQLEWETQENTSRGRGKGDLKV